jgi:Uri superfamily endonuclease
LTCVDQFGCLLDHCKSHNFADKYTALIKSAAEGNPHCSK